MKILEVIPLASLPIQVPQLLTYFHHDHLLKGALVEVLIGKRKEIAVVVHSSSLEEQKVQIKKSGFQLKKILSVVSEESKVSDIQFKIAVWLSKNYFAPLGLCLKTVLPSFFSQEKSQILNHKLQTNSKFEIQNLKFTILLSRVKDIVKNIEPEIKKLLKNKQVLIIVPEISIARHFYDYFVGYYETALIHGQIPQKKYRTEWDKIAKGETKIIIGTRLALFAPFDNLGLIILEDPANIAYKSDMTPKYWTPELTKKIAELYSCPLIYISQTLDIKNYFLFKNNQLAIENKITARKLKIEIIDMVQEIRNGHYSIFSGNLAEKIIEVATAKKKTLIFSSRKGYFSCFLCQNCSYVFKCPNCSVPLKPHKTTEPILLCHRCIITQKVPSHCPNCQSYRIKTGGFAGSQRIEEEINHLFKTRNIQPPPIFIIDKGTARNDKIEKEILAQTEESKSSVIIATQLIFSHRYSRQFDFIGIPNIDSLTTSPDFNSETDLFYQFQKLLDFEPEEIFIQTHNPDSPLLNFLVSGNYQSFFDQELAARQMLWYPPFAKLAKLSYKHRDRQKAEYEARVLLEKLKMVILQKKLEKTIKLAGPSPAFVEKEKSMYIYNIILKILPEQNPFDILRFVPSGWNIDIDPKSIL